MSAPGNTPDHPWDKNMTIITIISRKHSFIYQHHLFQASLGPLIVTTVDQPHLSTSLTTVKNLKTYCHRCCRSHRCYHCRHCHHRWNPHNSTKHCHFLSPSGWQQSPLGPWVLGLSDAKVFHMKGGKSTNWDLDNEITCHLASVYRHFGRPRSVGTRNKGTRKQRNKWEQKNKGIGKQGNKGTRRGHAIWQVCIGTLEVRGRWEPQGRLTNRSDQGKHHQGPEHSRSEIAWIWFVRSNTSENTKTSFDTSTYLKVKNGIQVFNCLSRLYHCKYLISKRLKDDPELMSQKFRLQYFAPKLYPSFTSLFPCQPWHSHLLVVLWPPRSEPSLGPKTAYRVVRTCSSANLWQQHCFYQIELFDHPVSWNHQHHQQQYHLVNLHCSTSLWASSFVLIIGATMPQAPASSARL